METEVKVLLSLLRERNFQLVCQKDIEWYKNPCPDGECSDLCAASPSSFTKSEEDFVENFISCRSLVLQKGSCGDNSQVSPTRTHKCRCVAFKDEFDPTLNSDEWHDTCVCSVYKEQDAIVATKCELSPSINLLKISEKYRCSVYDELKQEQLKLMKCENVKDEFDEKEASKVDPLCRPLIFHIKRDKMQTNNQAFNCTQSQFLQHDVKMNETLRMNETLKMNNTSASILASAYTLSDGKRTIFYDRSTAFQDFVESNTDRRSIFSNHKKFNLDIFQSNKKLLHSSMF